MTNQATHEFDIAVSFTGEDRIHADELAKLLQSHGVKVFYDEFFRSVLWGKDLYQHLQTIYKDRAKYCIIFVSKHYLAKNWTKHELEQAQARSFAGDREYILPVRLDDTILPGVNHTIGYIDLRHSSIGEIASLLLEKLGLTIHETSREADRANWKGDLVEYNGRMIASFWPKQIEQAQHRPVYLVTKEFERIRFGDEKRFRTTGRKPKSTSPCHDCAALPGQFHVSGCDMEECPSCRGQNISCGCVHRAITRSELDAWAEGDLE